jgi:hypothetical protein
MDEKDTPGRLDQDSQQQHDEPKRRKVFRTWTKTQGGMAFTGEHIARMAEAAARKSDKDSDKSTS